MSHDPYLHQTIARNLTDSELAHKIYTEGDLVLSEYRDEAAKRFGPAEVLGVGDLVDKLCQADIAEAMREPAIREACEELIHELNDCKADYE